MKYLLVNTMMAEAVNNGRKTKTRRAIKINLKKSDGKYSASFLNKKKARKYGLANSDLEGILEFAKEHYPPKYEKDEVVWLREPAKVVDFAHDGLELSFVYISDNIKATIDTPDRFLPIPPNVQMPKWIEDKKGVPNGCIKEMARAFLKITDIKTELLHDMTFQDAIDEGIEVHNVDMLVKENALDLTKKLATDDKKLSAIEMFVKDSFIDIWDKTAANGYKWKDNPLVYSYEFCKTKV